MDSAIIKKSDGNVAVDVRRGRAGQLVVRTENYFVLFIAAAETLILAAFITLNYFLRFDPEVRADCDMFNYEHILLTCDPSKVSYEWSRPYFDYGDDSKSSFAFPLNYEMPEWVFFLCLIIVPISVFFIVEGWYALYPERIYKEIVTMGEIVIPQVVRRLFRIIGGFLLGGSITGLFVSVMKFCIISPRPHFMSVCFNNTVVYSGQRVCEPGQALWSPQQKCFQSVPENDILEAMKSYPSYHASLASFAGIFTIAYCAVVVKTRGIYGVPLGIFMGVMVMAGIGATHRLATGHSFQSDLLAGAFIGTIVALFVAKVSLYNFKENIWGVKILNPPNRRASDNLLPVKELNGQMKSPTQVAQITEGESDSESEDSDNDYKRISSQIATFPVIPRAHPPPSNFNPQATHAVNSNIASRANEKHGVSRTHSSSLRNQNYNHFSKGERQHSSLPRNPAAAGPWVTENSGRTYNSPKQRLSAPSSEKGSPFEQPDRFERRGYNGPFLSAYKSPNDDKNAVF